MMKITHGIVWEKASDMQDIVSELVSGTYF